MLNHPHAKLILRLDAEKKEVKQNMIDIYSQINGTKQFLLSLLTEQG